MRVETSKGEAWPGQHEINFRYADALTMADNHVVYKNGAKEIAHLNGCSITFMAKPDHSWIGSSCHIHSSLWRGDESAFAGETPDVQALARRPDREPEGARDLPRAERQLVQALRGRLVGADDARLGPRQPHVRLPDRRPRPGAADGDADPGRRRESVPRVRGDHRRRARRDRERASSCRQPLEGNAYESDADRFPHSLREAIAALEGRHDGARARSATRWSTTTSTTRAPSRSCSTASSPPTSGSGSSNVARPRDRDHGVRRAERALGRLGRAGGGDPAGVRAADRGGRRPAAARAAERGRRSRRRSTRSTASSSPAARTSTRPSTARMRIPRRTGTRPERDRAELALLRAALERDMPVLAVCRGSQVLNVARGGDLVQHLPEVVGDEKHKQTPGVFADHEVEVKDGNAARLAARRARAGQVAPPPGLRHGRRGARRVGVGRRRDARGDRGSGEALRRRRPLAPRGGRGRGALPRARRRGAGVPGRQALAGDRRRERRRSGPARAAGRCAGAAAGPRRPKLDRLRRGVDLRPRRARPEPEAARRPQVAGAGGALGRRGARAVSAVRSWPIRASFWEIRCSSWSCRRACSAIRW